MLTLLSDDRDRICPLIQKHFGDDLKCVSQKESFSQSPNLTSSISSQPTQFHHNLPSIDHFVAFLQHNACDLTDIQCADSISYVSSADSVAIDYDATADTITLSIFWSQPHSKTAWAEDIGVIGPSGKVEVGILSNEKAIDPEDLTLGGYLAVVGQDSKLSSFTVSFCCVCWTNTRMKNRRYSPFHHVIMSFQTMRNMCRHLRR